MAARGAGVHAMMDLSDGLGLDLHRFADASEVGFELSDVPVAEGATIEEAISGGEDYELLIATDDAGATTSRLPGPRTARAAHHRRRSCATSTTRTLRGEEFERRGWQHQL